MAGPGGGPPRKSHTKSRKGCKTCKRRHIRCDENFPQCRNCTKHNTRCDYMDSPPPADDASRADGQNVLWNAAVEAEIETWMRTGIFPFPELGLVQSHQFNGLSKQELRLIHHVASIYRDLSRRSMLPCTAWVEKLPMFLEAALRFDFVMSAILSFSAVHLANEANSSEVSQMAYHHRGIALNGLHTAIGNFSEENSDAILAASILLSWQASEWSGWVSLVQGTSTVLNSMEPWKDNSMLAFFVENNCIFKAPAFMPPTFGGGGLMAPLLPDDDQSLQEAIHALRQLLAYLHHDAYLRQFVEEILRTAEEIDLSSRTTREDQLFEKLQFLRMRLLWAPIGLLQSLDQANLNLLVIAHLYSVAMAVDASLPELMGAAFGSLTSSPIDDIDRRIRFTSPQSFDSASPFDELMAFPRRMAHKSQHARGSVMGSTGIPDPVVPGQQSPYGFGGLNLDSAPHTPNFPPTFPMYAGNISQEDLSVPPSPFLTSYNPHTAGDVGSRRHSALINHSRPNSISLDRRSFSALGYREDSPAGTYSPAGYGSPAHSYVDSDRGSVFGEGSPVPTWGQTTQQTGGFTFDESLDKNKGKGMA